MLSKTDLLESRFFMTFLALLVAMGPFGIDAYMPMMPAVAAYFNTDLIAVNLTMSAFLIGTAVGQFFGGSLSDQLGRKKIGLVGLLIFFVSTIFIIQAGSIQTMQFYRFTQAIGSGFTSVICLAQVRDLYPKNEVMRRYANVMLIFLLTPLLAPLIGASMASLGWQSVFILLAGMAFFLFFTYLFLVPETRSELPEKFSFYELFKGYIRVATHRIDGRLTAIRFILFSTFSAGIFMTFIINAPLVFMQHYGLNEFQFAMVFASHGLMLMIGNRSAVKLAKSITPVQALNKLNLVQLLLSITLCTVVYFNLHSLTLLLALSLVLMGVNGAITPTASGAFIGYFDKNAGAASSLNTTMVFFSGAIIGTIATLLSENGLLPLFTIIALSGICARLVLLSIHDGR